MRVSDSIPSLSCTLTILPQLFEQPALGLEEIGIRRYLSRSNDVSYLYQQSEIHLGSQNVSGNDGLNDHAFCCRCALLLLRFQGGGVTLEHKSLNGHDIDFTSDLLNCCVLTLLLILDYPHLLTTREALLP